MTMSMDGSSRGDRGVLGFGAGASPGRYVITQPHERRSPSGPAPSRAKGGAPRPSPIYALGQIGYDRTGGGASAPPRELRALLRYLDADPSRAAGLSWTLEQGGAPVYALRPGGSLFEYASGRLCALLRALAAGRLARVSVPGVVVGRTTLANGRLVPVLEPEPFGLYGWTAPPSPAKEAPRSPAPLPREEPTLDASDLFGKAGAALLNPGASPRERAINYAATEAYQTGTVYAAALHQGMYLDAVEALACPPYRPGADCWEVKLSFMRPTNGRRYSRMVYHFTVDVGEVVPVTVGKARSWDLS